MTDDRQEFAEARDAGLRARHETRLKRAIAAKVPCRCGHPIDRHDANECWTAPDGAETHGETSCPCSGYEPKDPAPCQPGCEFVAPYPDDARCPVHGDDAPTFTASEVKELTMKATAVALALGRKEACEEAIERLSELAQRIAPGNPHPTLGRDTVVRYLQDIASRVPGGRSEPLTAAPTSPSTPEESMPTESAFPDLPEGSDQ